MSTTLIDNRVGRESATVTRGLVSEPPPSRGTTDRVPVANQPDVYDRAMRRLANPGETVPIEDVLGPLDGDGA
jgi:hypothetical protein